MEKSEPIPSFPDTPDAEQPGGFKCTRRQLVAGLSLQALALPLMPALGAAPSHTEAADHARQPASVTPTEARAVVSDKAKLFPLRDIRLLPGPMYDGQDINRRYLLTLEPDRLLSWFRREARLEQKAPPYRGWESEGNPLPGHILGFYMSGAAMMVQATGDAELARRLEYILDELDRVQTAHGNGFMLASPGGEQIFNDVANGKIEVGGLPFTGSGLNGAFEPTYTLNKLMLGLYQVLLATGNAGARKILIRLADWFGEDILDRLSEAQTQTLLDCEHGSLNESFADVYRLTGDRKYLVWARRLCHERMLAPLAAGDGGFLDRYHANTQIPKFTGFEEIFALNGEETLHRAAVNFWNEVVDRRTWAIGGNSAAEHFFNPAETDRALHELAGPESCNTVNMLRLTEALFRRQPSGRLMDYYERSLFNHLLAVHDPERGMFVYYTALFPGAYRVYSDPFDSMWCCVGTGLEAPGKYGQMIYTCAPDGSALYVHLFIASRLEWREAGVTARQDTRFPDDPATTLTVERARPAARFGIRIRHPEWVDQGTLRVAVNGKIVTIDTGPGDYAEVRRTWRRGDTIHVDLPMRTVAEPLTGAPRYVSLRHGPIVLAGALGRDGLKKEDFWAIGDMVARKTIPEASVPAFTEETPAMAARRVAPVKGRPLTFRVTGLSRPDGSDTADVEMVPFFRCHFQRYAVYWQNFTPEEMRAEQTRIAAIARVQAALDARTLDRVRIGDPDSEKAHNLQGERTETGGGAYGRFPESRWRDAREGGWFGYDLAVPSGRPVILRCTFWGQEQGARAFDIVVNGKTLASESLGDTGTAGFFSRDIPVPPALTHDNSVLRVRFQAHPANMAGGLFDLRALGANGA